MPLYYKGKNGILVVYDITNRQSFDDINFWLNEIEKIANKNTVLLLVGNKCDLEDERKVSFQEGKDFADNNGMKFIETSAKTNQNVDEAFEILIDEVIKNNKDILKKIDKNIVLERQNVYKKKVGGCC
jgi:small GTP-binding protein